MKRDEGELKKSLMCFVILRFFLPTVSLETVKVRFYYSLALLMVSLSSSHCVALVTVEADTKLKIRLINNKT